MSAEGPRPVQANPSRVNSPQPRSTVRSVAGGVLSVIVHSALLFRGRGFLLLDERGAQFTSKELAALIQTYRDAGTPRLNFAIGDAHGFTDEERARASKVMALSRLTLPHRLARDLMVEQLYRASTILEGHPYHHE